MTQLQNKIPEIDWFKLADFIGANPELVAIWSFEDKRWALNQAMNLISPTKTPFSDTSQRKKANFWEWSK